MERFTEQSEEVESFLATTLKKKKAFPIMWKIPNISCRNIWVTVTLFCFGEYIMFGER